MLIRDIVLRSCPGTGIGLNKQLFAEMSVIAPGKLLDIPASSSVILGPGATPCFVGGPTARARLLAAIADRGEPMVINSAYRTVAQQFLLFRMHHLVRGSCGIAAVANPGRSNHESGLALDIENPLSWKRYLEPQGWKWFGPGDPPHYDFIGGTDLRKLGVRAFQTLWSKNHPGDNIDDGGNWGPVTMDRLLKTPVNGFP